MSLNQTKASLLLVSITSQLYHFLKKRGIRQAPLQLWLQQDNKVAQEKAKHKPWLYNDALFFVTNAILGYRLWRWSWTLCSHDNRPVPGVDSGHPPTLIMYGSQGSTGSHCRPDKDRYCYPFIARNMKEQLSSALVAYCLEEHEVLACSLWSRVWICMRRLKWGLRLLMSTQEKL